MFSWKWLGLAPIAVSIAGCGNTSPTVSASDPCHHHQATYPTVDYNLTTFQVAGVGLYHLSVPQSYVSGNGPMAQLVDMPEGAVWMTPPGFWGVHEKPLTGWNVWLTPWHAGGGSLWKDARLIKHLPQKNATFSILGDTGPDAVFEETAHGIAVLFIVNTQSGTVHTIANPITGSALVEDGFLAYQSHQSLVVATLPGETLSTVPLPSQASGQSMTIVSHGIAVGPTVVPFSAIPTMPSLSLPTGYRWLTGITGRDPIVAIPDNWIASTDNPGGSSYLMTAKDPTKPAVEITVQVNGCTGCWEPNGSIGMMDSPDTPVAGPYRQVNWINDHITFAQSQKNGMVTGGETLVWPNGGMGNISISWTIPQNDTALAQVFQSSIMAAWRSTSAGFGNAR